jgi:molybdate transport system regulatory protein
MPAKVFSARPFVGARVPNSTSKNPRRLLRPAFRLWLEDGKREIIFDQTDALLLRRIAETRSLTQAARQAGISYRNAWERVRTMEGKLGLRLVETTIGGKTGGGATLTEEGARLLKEFRKTRKLLFNVLDDDEAWEDVGYRLSARNKLKARVIEVKKGVVTSQVKMRLLSANTLTSIITNEAVEDLSLKVGDSVEAIVKSTDVLVAKSTSYNMT